MQDTEYRRLAALLEAIDMPAAMGAALLGLARGEELPAPPPGADELLAHLLLSLRNRADGPWQGLPEDVFIATMQAFSRFVREHERSFGCVGFDRAFWTTRQASAALLRVGEMEYERRESEGERWLSLHIPSNTRLLPELLNASVDRARALFAAHFPRWADAPIRLHSWLLSPALPALLPEGSRIVRFQRAFDVTELDPDPIDCLEWVFHIPGARLREARLADLEETTSLQRSMKAYLLAGGKVGDARGVLARAFD